MKTFEILKAAKHNTPYIIWARVEDGLAISNLMVCKSAAGYYPGRMCFDHDCGFIEPYSRDKEYGYFPTAEAVIDAVGKDLVII